MFKKIITATVLFIALAQIGTMAHTNINNASGKPGLFFGIGRTSSIRTSIPSDSKLEEGLTSSIRTDVPSDLEVEAGLTSSIRTDVPSDLEFEAGLTSSIRTNIPSDFKGGLIF